jgi:hypothetical protein
MSELGMIYDEVVGVAQEMGEVSSVLGTGRDVCDGVTAALSACSAIPGAVAVTGPVIATYESIRPTLSAVIDICQAVNAYLKLTTQIVQGADQVCQGNFQPLAQEAFRALGPQTM